MALPTPDQLSPPPQIDEVEPQQTAPAAPAAAPEPVVEPDPVPAAATNPDPVVEPDPAPAAAPDPAPAVAPQPPAAAVNTASAAVPANTVPANTVPAVAQVGGSSAIVQQASKDGFEGVDLDVFGVFPIVSLKDGEFQSTEGWSLGREFHMVMTAGRKKFAYKNGLPDSDPDSTMFYTYDSVHTTSGELVENVLKEWAEKGWRKEVSPYVDIMGTVHGGERDGSIILLSTPKTSIGRYSGHYMRLKATGRPFDQIITRIGKGEKFTVRNFDVTPYDFSIAGFID